MGATAVALLMVAASCTGDEPKRSRGTSRAERAGVAAADTDRTARGPSQSAEHATRDGVVQAVAALPFDVRVDPIGTVRVDDQVWVISRMRHTDRPGVDCDGEQAGEYGVDWVCGSEYGELLLLNRRGTKILRALPLPSVPPQNIAVTEDAAYCGRAGDGGLPHSMVCRVDAQTFETTVRIFWGKDNRAQPPKPTLLRGWKLHEEYLPMYAFKADEGAVWAKDRYEGNTWTKLDPATLQIVDEKVVRPSS